MSERKEIIQVVSSMDPGGIETWLMNVLRNIDRNRFHFIFCTTSEEPGFFDKEIGSLGGSVIHCPINKGYLKFARRFVSILSETGCDVVHSHGMFLCGLVMRLARKAGVPIRITHSHAIRDDHPDSLRRGGYRWLMRRFIRRYATNGIGCSEMAADYLFTPSWRRWNGYGVATCAIDTSAFQATVDRSQLCKSFGIPADVRIVGHVGHFRYGNPKKQDFLLHIAAAMLRKREDIHLVLVGDGPLKPKIESLADELSISNHVTFAGRRDDVPVLMRNLFDLFVLPSEWEGLGLVIIESQCAGLASLISDVIPPEVTVIDELVKHQSLEAGPEVWAERAFEILERPPYDKDKALMQIEKSKFGITSSVKFLSDLYSANLTSCSSKKQ